MNPQVWWYVARSSGIVAWALLSVAVCWGLFLSTKAVAKATTPARVLELHRFLSGAAVVATATHLASLVADGYVHFGWAEVLVPLASPWKPVAVASGVIGLYLLVAVEVTSLMMNRLPRKAWRWIHRTSFGLWLLATTHGLQAGTDTANPMFKLGIVASTNLIAFLTIVMIVSTHRRAVGRQPA